MSRRARVPRRVSIVRRDSPFGDKRMAKRSSKGSLTMQVAGYVQAFSEAGAANRVH